MATLHKTLTDWAKVYGPVYKIKIMGRYTVVFNGYQAVHECLVDGGKNTAGRPTNFRMKHHFKNAGFARPHPDESWKFIRRRFHQFAKPFGDGLQKLEVTIVAHTKDMLATFRKAASDNRDLNPMEAVLDSSLMMIIQLLCGDLLNADDPLLLSIKEYDRYIWKILGGTSLDFELLEICPWLLHAPLGSSRLLRKADDLKYKIMDELKQRALSRDWEQTLVGYLWQHQEKLTQERSSVSAPENAIGEDILTSVLVVLFSARTSSGLAFTCLLNLLAHHQSVQDRLAEELFAVSCDADEYVTLKNREAMPYTQATLLESLRYQSPSPISTPRSTVYSPITVSGLRIPENTEFMGNIWSVHRDKAFWGDPEIFRPERFLDGENKLVSCSDAKRRHLLPFGAGIRSCPAEQLALSRLFLWLANTCKKFRIFPGTGNTPDLAEAENFRNDFLMYPPRFNVRFERR